MRILIVAQDLRISGTSEGIVSRSFITRLREVYPSSYIEVNYLKNHSRNVKSELLSANAYKETVINQKINWWTIFINRFYWRLTGISLKELYLEKQYGKELKKIKSSNFNVIFLRSSGTAYELILGALEAPELLRKSIINFHDPFPIFWDTGSNIRLDNLELQRLKRMNRVVDLACKCITPSKLLSQDMEFLYGTNKRFHTLPHQFDLSSFNKPDFQNIRKKTKNISLSYHGAVQFKRNIDILIDAFIYLTEHDDFINDNVELVLRLRGNHTKRLIEKYNSKKNVFILDTLSFIESYYEQKEQADVLIMLENCSPHSNILPGKTPVIASLNKPVLAISPERSELRIILNDDSIADCNNFDEVKVKLKNKIESLGKDNSIINSFNKSFYSYNLSKELEFLLADFQKDTCDE